MKNPDNSSTQYIDYKTFGSRSGVANVTEVKDANTITIGIYKKDYIDMFLSLIDKYKITCLLRKWKQIMEVKDPLASTS